VGKRALTARDDEYSKLAGVDVLLAYARRALRFVGVQSHIARGRSYQPRQAQIFSMRLLDEQWQHGLTSAPTGRGVLRVALIGATGSTGVTGATGPTGPTGALPILSTTGATAGTHIVRGTVAVSGSSIVILTGAAVFSSGSSYSCTASEVSGGRSAGITRTDGSHFTIGQSGNGATVTVDFICVGT